MDLLEWFVLIATLIQSLDTGTFLTLDVTNKDLQKAWGFTADKMVSVGTVGYSLGFLGVAIYGLYINRITRIYIKYRERFIFKSLLFGYLLTDTKKK